MASRYALVRFATSLSLCFGFQRVPLLKHSLRTAKSGIIAATTLPSVRKNPSSSQPLAQLKGGEAEVLSDVEEDAGVEQFEWFKQWYPLRVAEFLDSSRPHAVQLLGRELVLWNDGTAWRCYEDACPHRMAPLSEGRVERDGSLMCAYHAWRFAGPDGRCVDIPQSPPEVKQKHQSMPSACAKSYPVRVAQGIIFVWPEPGQAAEVASAARSPSIVPELDDPELLTSSRVVMFPNICREMPVGWDTYFENAVDPAHVPVSHHGFAGNRYTDARPITLKSLRPVETQGGMCFEYVREQDGQPVNVKLDWRPPGHSQIRFNNANGGVGILSVYAAPTMPGWCVGINRQILIKNEQGKLPPSRFGNTQLLPAWLAHPLNSLALHQDQILMYHQQHLLKSAGVTNENFHRKIYTPNGQDKMVLTFRRWLAQRGGGGIPWPAGTDASLPRLSAEEVFDVYHTHTKDCVTCQTALHNFEKVIAVLKVASVLALTAAARSGPVVPEVVLAAACFGAATGLDRFKQLYYAYDFHHQDNN